MLKLSGRFRAGFEECSPSLMTSPLYPLSARSFFFDQSTSGGHAVMTRVHSWSAEWLSVSIAPFDADLEVCVMDYDGILHALVFPCRKNGTEWVNPATKGHIDIQPTHWRKWAENR